MKILGFTEDVTSCDCCGKVELKGTYVMEDENLNIFYYGTTCGAKSANYSVKEFNSYVKKIELINKIDTEVSNLKGDGSKMKIYKSAIAKGYNKYDFFKKHGKLIESTPWGGFYLFAHLTHQIIND